MKETTIHSLPGPIQFRLEQTLAQWRQWQCDPPLTGPPASRVVLGGGVSNFSVLVHDDRSFVVRLDGIDPRANGLHRQLEWRALQAASSARLAPAARYFNPELGSLVCDYLPPDQDQSHSPGQTGELLKRIHELPPLHHRLDLGERITRLEKSLVHRGESMPTILAGLRGEVFTLLEQLRTLDRSSSLCHNDLLTANRLCSGGTLWALDWEYCAMGSPWYDLAATVCGDNMDKEQTTELVRAYLGRPARAEEWALLLDYGRVYRYLEILWYLAAQKQTVEGFLEQRITALADAWSLA